MPTLSKQVRDIAMGLAQDMPINVKVLRDHLCERRPGIWGEVEGWSDLDFSRALTTGSGLIKCHRKVGSSDEFVWIRIGAGVPEGFRELRDASVVMGGLDEDVNGREALVVGRRMVRKMGKRGGGMLLIVRPEGQLERPSQGPIPDDEWKKGVADLVELGGSLGVEVVEVEGGWEGLQARLNLQGPGRSLFVYYSDHATGGGLHIGGVRTEWRPFMVAMGVARWDNKLVVLEACCSGEAARIVTSWRNSDEVSVYGALIVLTSATASGACSRTRKGSCFTRRFLAGCGLVFDTFGELLSWLIRAAFKYESQCVFWTHDDGELVERVALGGLLIPSGAEDEEFLSPEGTKWMQGGPMDGMEGGPRESQGAEMGGVVATLRAGIGECPSLDEGERQGLLAALGRVNGGMDVGFAALERLRQRDADLERRMAPCWDVVDRIVMHSGQNVGYYCEMVLLAAALGGCDPGEFLRSEVTGSWTEFVGKGDAPGPTNRGSIEAAFV